MLGSVESGVVERDFEEPVDIQIKKYTWIGTLTHMRQRPAVYYVEVSVYRKGDQKSKKMFPDMTNCEAYCLNENCKCESCSEGECTIVSLEKSTTSEAVPFIGFVETGSENSINITGMRFVSLLKDSSSQGVKIGKAEEYFSVQSPLKAIL